MSDSRHIPTTSSDEVLRWPGRLVTVDALQQEMNGHRELSLLPSTIITPLANDWLQQRRIRIRQRQSSEQLVSGWGWVQERNWSIVPCAVAMLKRNGHPMQELPACQEDIPLWAKEVAAVIAAGQCVGGVVFTREAGLFACIANKLPGLRAVVVNSVLEAARAMLTIGANLLVVPMPGRTFFEVRQILNEAVSGQRPTCPDNLAHTLRELDGHAHC